MKGNSISTGDGVSDPGGATLVGTLTKTARLILTQGLWAHGGLYTRSALLSSANGALRISRGWPRLLVLTPLW